MKLLLADDEPDMIRALSAILTHEGYKVDAVCDGAEALEKAAAVSYDGLILDIMMPKLDGLAVLSALRDKDILTPVLLLTAKSQTEDKISGLDCGADDYLTKPFDIGEFLARVRALTRRSAAKQLSGLTCGNFPLDRASMELSCGTSSVCLYGETPTIIRHYARLVVCTVTDGDLHKISPTLLPCLKMHGEKVLAELRQKSVCCICLIWKKP